MKTMLFKWGAAIAGFMQLAVAAPAFGQTSDAVLACAGDDCFREGYKDSLNVSTGVIVGLSLGGGTGLASIRKVLIDKSGFPRADTFCLKETSVDGLFWAENAYRGERSSGNWRVAPLARKFHDQLESYGADRVLVTATLPMHQADEACGAVDVVYAPIKPDEKPSGQLTAYVNSSRRYTEAGLWPLGAADDAAPIVEARCEEADLETAGVYDQKCNFDLEEMSIGGVHELRLFFEVPPFGMEPWTGRVALPAGEGSAQAQ